MNISSIKFTIGVGKTKDGSNLAGPDNTHPEKVSAADSAIEAVCLAVAYRFGGYTKTQAFGGWYDAKRYELVEEPAVVIEAAVLNRESFDVPSPALVEKICEITSLAKDLLNQECVLVQYIAGNSVLV